MTRLTVRELPYLKALTGARIVAGQAGADAAVREARLIDHLDRLADTPAGCALLLTTDLTGWAVEMALRLAWERAAACVIAHEDQEVLDATHRLADRLRMPLLLAGLDDPVSTAIALGMAATAPRERRAATLVDLAERLAALPQKPRSVLGLLNSRLPGTAVCLLTADGTLLAGRSAASAHGADVRDTVPARHTVAEGQLVVHPVIGSDGGVEMRLVASLSGAADAWADTVATALGLAAGPITAWAAVERLRAERDARLRGTLLTELLSGTDATSDQIASQVARLGWRLEGWHTGIYLSLADPTDQETLVARTPALTAALAAVRLRGVVVERTDGWSVWVDHLEKPSPRTEGRMADRLRALLAERPAGLALSGGIGPPGEGPSGLRTSLASAREAAVLATAAGPGHLERADDLGMRRLLLTPFGSEDFRSLADRLLAPLREPRNRPLYDALRQYLDQMCSASATAAALGVHRNTVATRVARACTLLGVDLDRPDERLAVHLACHAVGPPVS